MERKVTSYQAILLILIFRVIIGFSYLPSINIIPANQDAWIVLLLSIPYVLLLCFPVLFLSNRFNELTLIEYMENIFGKVIGKIVGSYYSLFFLVSAIFFLSLLIEMLDSTMFPNTPTWFTALIGIATCTYVAYKGLITMCKTGEIIVPFILIVIFLLSVLGWKRMDLKVLLPILKDSTLDGINKGTIDVALRFTDILVLAMITPYLEEKEKLNSIFYKCLIYSTLIIVLMLIVTQSVLGIEQAKHANFPFFTYTRTIELYHFIERIESIFIVTWIMGSIGKISGLLYFSSVSMSQVLNKTNNKPYIIPNAVIVLIASVILKDNRPIVAVKHPIQGILLIISLISMFIIPLIALIVYLFRRKSIEANKYNKNSKMERP